MEKRPDNSSLKILCFFAVTVGALFASLSVLVLKTFAYSGGGYILSLESPEVTSSVLGSLGTSFMAMLLGASGGYLLIAIWAFWSYSIGQIFTEEIDEILRNINNWWKNDRVGHESRTLTYKLTCKYFYPTIDDKGNCYDRYAFCSRHNKHHRMDVFSDDNCSTCTKYKVRKCFDTE